MGYIIMFDNSRSMKENDEINQFIYFKEFPPKLKGSYSIFEEI